MIMKTALRLCATWLLLGTMTPALRADDVIFVNSRAALSGDDSIQWSQLGPPQTAVGNWSYFETDSGNVGIIYQYGGGILYRLNNGHGEGDQSGGWSGSFKYGEPLIGGFYGGGVIPIYFSTPVAAAGAQVEINASRYGSAYTVRIEAYNAAQQFIGSGIASGNVGYADNAAVFLGLRSSTANISYILFRVLAGDNWRADSGVAINTVSIGTHASRRGPLGFAVDNSRDLYLIELQTGLTKYIGHMGVFLEGLALSPSGQLFGTGADSSFYAIDPDSAAATLVGNTGFNDVEGLHFRGPLLLGAPASIYPQFIAIDAVTAQSRLLFTSPNLSGGATAMTLKDDSTALLSTFRYGTYGSTYVNELRSVDLNTGVGTVLGTIRSGTFVSGLDFGSDGRLYGLDTSGNVLSIDPHNAATSVITNNGRIWLDLAAIPSLHVSGVAINGGAADRSNVRNVGVTFDANIDPSGLGPASISIVNASGAVVAHRSLDYDPASRTLLIGLSGGDGRTTLADGHYEVRLDTLLLHRQNLSAATLSDDDGAEDGIYRIRFFRLAGDFNGDRKVDADDQVLLLSGFGSKAGAPNYNLAYDLNGDGVINLPDFQSFRRLLGHTL